MYSCNQYSSSPGEVNLGEDMHGSRFLKALLGDDCAGALVEAVRRTPGLEAVLTPRAMVSWLAALGPRYSGPIPGVAGALAFERVDGLYKGEVTVEGQTFSYDQIPGLELAALLAVGMGDDAPALAPVKQKDLVRLGKSLDSMVFAVLGSQRRSAARQMIADQDPDLLIKGHFAQAGFMDLHGKVVGTGPFHNVDELPPGFQVHKEGFIGHDGRFFDREQAAAHVKGPMSRPHELHSVETIGNQPAVSGAHQALMQRIRAKYAKKELDKVEPKGTTAKPAGPQEAAAQTGAQPPRGPQRQARQTASASHVPGITSPINATPSKGKTLKMEKHQASKPCKDCGHVRFVDGRFVGCPCFSELAKNVTTLLVGAHYLLKFSPDADVEDYTALAMSVSGER